MPDSSITPGGGGVSSDAYPSGLKVALVVLKVPKLGGAVVVPPAGRHAVSVAF